MNAPFTRGFPPKTKARIPKTSFELRVLRRHAGLDVVEEYMWTAPTGKHSDREQFQRLFEDASQRKFDLVAVLVARSVQPRGRA